MKKFLPMFSVFITSIILTLSFSSMSYAESHYGEKLEFAETLEEVLGHFWALEQNLDEGNAELALVHATHPIAELYDLLKPELVEYDPTLDANVQKTLMTLGEKTGSKVTRSQAQQAIDDAKNLVEQMRLTVIGADLSNDVSFKLNLMKGLLGTSEVEYEEAVSNGMIEEMAEFQDGSAFVWRSQQIFDSIKSQLPEHEVEEIEEFYEELWSAYDRRADPATVETFVDGIIHEVSEILGEEDEGENDLLTYAENIEYLLTQAKKEYANGNNDAALSLVTKAYLDNFEFLESPLVDAGQEELMEEVEHMMREELREMIRNDAPISEVETQIDTLLIKMEAVEMAVPEFGTIAMLVMVVAIIGIVIVTAQHKKLTIFPRF